MSFFEYVCLVISDNMVWLIIRITLVTLLAVSIKMILFSKQSQTRKLVGTISQIRVHPIKSTAPQQKESWNVSMLGLEHDRQFILVNQYGTMLTLRRYPKLVLVRTKFADESVEVSGEGMPLLTLPLVTEINSDSLIQTINVFNISTEGVHVSKEADLWFSKYLHIEGLQLFSFPKNGVPRLTADLGVKEDNYKSDPLMFADGCPLLLLSEESVAEINDKCGGTNVTVDRFRPNVVIKGCDPFDEDNWGLIQIGDHTKLQCLYPCQRCVAVNVDMVKGTIDSSNTRLLKELESIRATPEGKFPAMPPKIPIVGCNYGVRSSGRIKVGDPVYHIYNKN